MEIQKVKVFKFNQVIIKDKIDEQNIIHNAFMIHFQPNSIPVGGGNAHRFFSTRGDGSQC